MTTEGATEATRVDRDITVLKLGGSVVTDKDERETVDIDTLAPVARAIAAAKTATAGRGTGLVVVHGGGSFGHHYAAKHGVSRTEGTRNVEAIRTIHDAMGRLNKAVLDFLGDAGVDAVPVRPYSASRRTAAGELELYTDQIESMLSEGFVPVLHGDVVTHAEKGATILSGDELVTKLAKALSADRVGVCSTVPGVLDDQETVIPEIETLDEVSEYLGESESTDVTGGMEAKVAALLALDAPASIFGPDDLQAFLSGESVGTLVDARTGD